MVAALPKPDVKLDAACPPVKYMHRSLKDGEVYFFFNESAQNQSRNRHRGRQRPGAGLGRELGEALHRWQRRTAEKESVRFTLASLPYESKFIVIGP